MKDQELYTDSLWSVRNLLIDKQTKRANDEYFRKIRVRNKVRVKQLYYKYKQFCDDEVMKRIYFYLVYIGPYGFEERIVLNLM
jgi:hypothetical protein